jgi:hypothetical protein
VNGLEKEYEGTLECDVFDATTAASKQAISEYGFENHGLVIFDAQGDVQKKMDGHDWTEVQIRTALSDVMGGA